MINVIRKRNEITIYRMNHPKVVSELISALWYGRKDRYEDFILNFKHVDSAFPNVCVPLAGIIDFYKNLSIKFIYENIPRYIESNNILEPLNVGENQIQLRRSALDILWRFNSAEDIQLLVDIFVETVSQAVVCEVGVLEALTWCLNEIMDNVLQHSKKSYGFVMGQIHKRTNHIAFCIFDNGQGIYNSLKNTMHTPRHPVDAITLAIKEGITRDKAIGQGNGMWGLHELVKNNSGRLYITSASGSYFMLRDRIQTFKKVPYLSKEFGTSTIDFQIEYDKSISFSEALGGYKPVNLRVENLEDDKGDIHYTLSRKSSGTGTRQSGEKIRNELINLYKEARKILIIDFEGVSVISSSFADELIGKLVTYFGFFGFNQIVRLKNMNNIVQAIAQRSVAQRMSESYQRN